VVAPSPVTKAVIPAAGLGTRFLPATKAQPKEMLPVVDKPAIQYVVEEAVRAGIEDICIVTSSSKRSLEDHFDRNFELEHLLTSKGKDRERDDVVALTELADFHYVRQGEPLGLGHAVATARRHIGDSPFVVLLGDEFMAEGSGLLEGMIATHQQHGCSVLALMEVEGDEIARYGSADSEPFGDRLVKVNGVVEKPKPADAPSNLAVMGRYVFTPQIFEHIARLTPGAGGELQLTDAIGTLLREQQVLGFTFSEGRYDTGVVLDYLKVIVEMAAARPDIGPEFSAFLKDFVANV
jgi:UTP--glucose-1-phosphate uridylyltransferase